MQGRIGHTKLESWLSESGLEPEDMLVRPLDASVKNALNLPSSLGPDDAAVIPYFGITGSPIAFYRARLLTDGEDNKYRQAKDTESRVYFPRKFAKVLDESKSNYVVMTEGEKKAACAVKNGIPAIAFGGVWSFRNKTTFIPLATHSVKAVNRGRSEGSKGLVIKGQETGEEETSLAEGLTDLISLRRDRDLYFIIAYDTDIFGVKEQVQNAAAMLAHDLVAKGIEWIKIRQLVLPNRLNGSGELRKVGLDDYIVSNPETSLKELIERTIKSRIAFPRFPRVKEWVTKTSVKSRSQEEDQRLALMMHVELEYRGQRFQTSNYERYYQVKDKGIVLPADFPTGQGSPGVDRSRIFGYLWNEFGLMSNMDRAIMHLSSWFSYAEGIITVEPSKVLSPVTIDGDRRNLAIQLTDHTMVVAGITEPKVELNGSHTVMFLQDHITTTNESEFPDRLVAMQKNLDQAKPLSPWVETMMGSNIVGEKDKLLFALMAHIYPWLQLWDDYRMPILHLQGEHQSGKSAVVDLLQLVVTGRPRSKRRSGKEGDLNSFISQAGPLLVFDNTGAGSKRLTAEMSDEISRLVTSMEPTVATRKLYTTDEVKETPVRTCFVVTSISSPFRQLDFISRSIEFNFTPSDEVNEDWAKEQFHKYGGRAGWLAYHVAFLQKFFRLIDEQYKIHKRERRDRFRLKGFVAALETTARVLGLDWKWIGPYIDQRQDEMARDSDRAIQGLIVCNHHTVGRKHKLRDIVRFFTDTDDPEIQAFSDNYILRDVVNLEKFVKMNDKRLRRVVGLVKTGVLENNVQQYVFEPIVEHSGESDEEE